MTEHHVMSAAAAASFVRRAWPTLAGLSGVLLGLLLLAATALVHDQRATALERGKELRAELERVVDRERRGAAGATTALDLPGYHTHLSDVQRLIQTATEQAVRLGALQFRTDRLEKLPYTVRVAEFRVDEDYPRLKSFVAELLRRLPHAYLDELRVDQAGDANGKVQANLRLSFVYQGEPARTGSSP